MNEWAILGAAIVVVSAAVYFIFIRVKTDPRVKELADLAYKVAAEIAGVSPKGSTPPVNLKNSPWGDRGVTILGNYRSYGFFGLVLWDRILVLKAPDRIWRILIHEMTHAIRRRRGLPSSEAIASAAGGRAAEMAPPEVAALLEKLR